MRSNAERTGLGSLVALAILAGAAAAQEAPEPEPESGAELFFTHCGACHGKGGEGDGPAAAKLEFVPPDLTRIAERAGGEFPADQVARIIDGRDPVEGHGGPEMPIWGDGFRFEEDGFDEAAAQARIQRVVDHIKTLQKEKQ